MSETTYSIEISPSSRSKCKKCKEKILKDELRIGTHSPNPDSDKYAFTSWQKTACFTKPRKFKELSFEDFIDTILQDPSNILQKHRDDVLQALKSKKEKKAAPKKNRDDEEDDDKAKPKKEKSKAYYNVARWKKIANELLNDDDGDDDDEDVKPSAKKKRKKENIDDDANIDIRNITEQDKKESKAYAVYAQYNLDNLKDILRYNRQMVSGAKDILLQRIVDGHVNGRVSNCPSCSQGRPRLNDDGITVSCPGYFDEDVMSRVTCFYSNKKDDVGRFQPWFQNEPTEEEDELISKQIEEGSKATTSSSATTGQNNERMQNLQKQVKEKIDWNVKTGQGVKSTTKEVYKLCKKVLDLPSDERNAMTEIGKIILQNRNNKTSDEILVIVTQQFKFLDDVIEEKKRQTNVSKSICVVEENGNLFLALTELSNCYLKEKNSHAGNSYRKVANAIKDLDYEITEDNALGLGKGKTKVAGIGKKSAELILEFVTTGTMEKLEEKRRL